MTVMTCSAEYSWYAREERVVADSVHTYSVLGAQTSALVWAGDRWRLLAQTQSKLHLSPLGVAGPARARSVNPMIEGAIATTAWEPRRDLD